MNLFSRKGTPGVLTYQTWLSENLEPDSVVGIDPKLITSTSYLALSNSLSATGLTLKSIERNLVDIVWTEKDNQIFENIIVLPLEFSGRTISEKLADVRRDLTTIGVETHLISTLDDIACKFRLLCLTFI